MKATIEWFKIYKIPDGKPENQFAFNGEAKPRDFALHIIDEVHQHWQNLIKQETPSGGIIWFISLLGCIRGTRYQRYCIFLSLSLALDIK